MPSWDEQDRKIMESLQKNARTSNAEIARSIGMAPSAVLERVRRLQADNVIVGFEARLSPEALGLGLTAFSFVKADLKRMTEVVEGLTGMKEIAEVHDVAGEESILIKVRVASPDALAQLIREKIGVIPGVTGTRTTVVLRTEKETAALPIPGSEG